MKASLKEMLDKIGVGYVLSAYETCPWSVYDGEKALTCSAEVRMNNECTECEAEIQLMYDTPPEGKPPVEQFFWMLIKPVSEGNWETKALKVRGEDETALSSWGEKGADLFAACVQEMKMDKMPDFDDLVETILRKKDYYGGGAGAGGGKSPKIKPQQLLDMKQGRGF